MRGALGRAMVRAKLWVVAESLRFLDMREVARVSAAITRNCATRMFSASVHTVDSDGASPRACFPFSEDLRKARLRAVPRQADESRADQRGQAALRRRAEAGSATTSTSAPSLPPRQGEPAETAGSILFATASRSCAYRPRLCLPAHATRIRWSASIRPR